MRVGIGIAVMVALVPLNPAAAAPCAPCAFAPATLPPPLLAGSRGLGVGERVCAPPVGVGFSSGSGLGGGAPVAPGAISWRRASSCVRAGGKMDDDEVPAALRAFFIAAVAAALGAAIFAGADSVLQARPAT